jgi:Ca2+-binding RTX toxin-like protein
MTFPIKWGPEFLVNTTTASSQFDPAITGLADGRFLVCWTDFSEAAGDTSNYAVRAQVFNADGSKAGSEFVVNTTKTNDQFEPAATALDDGRFVVAWRDESQTGGDQSSSAVRAQIFNPDGSKSGAQFLVNTTTFSGQWEPAVTTLADGRFVVAWTDASVTGDDTSALAVRGQVFNPDGSKSGSEFLVNSTTDGFQWEPAVSALADGRFVVAWRDESETGEDTSTWAVRAQVFNADGSTSGPEFLVNTTTASGQFDPAVAALADGRFVVAWTDDSRAGGDTSLWAVRAQVFAADGTKAGNEFLVATTTAEMQWQPALTALPDGRFVAVWRDESKTGGDTSLAAVRAQVFDPDGSKSGPEFLVNTTTGFDQWEPTVTALADGRFAVAWTDASQTGGDTSGWAVRGQIFDPRTSAVNLNGTALADQFVGTGHGDWMAGHTGNDSIDGASGDDRLYGESGNDTLLGGAGHDILDGGLGNDSLVGGLGGDRLTGSAGNDILDGGFGADTLEGGAANDTYTIDNVGDVVTELAGGGSDLVKSSIDYTLGANLEHLTLLGIADLAGTGNNLSNIVTGNAGRNLLQGLGGSDTILGLGGNDSLDGGGGNDRLDGSTGADTLEGGSGNDTLLGGTANDRLFGAGGNDSLDGGSHNDSLDGGTGADTLIGGLGLDTLTGGADADRFVFDPSHGSARITDFEDNLDRIDLTGFGFSTVAEAKSYAADVAGDVVFTFADGDQLTVENITKAQLTRVDLLI